MTLQQAVGVKSKKDQALQRAWAAVAAFNKQKRSLEGLVEALAGRRIPVVAGIGSGAAASSTDGKKIYITPPIEMGDKLEHDRPLCGKRSGYKQLCPACSAHEHVIAMIFHELGHNVFETFGTSRDFQSKNKVALQEFLSVIQDRELEQWIELGPRLTLFEIAERISKYGTFILNVLEDVRIDTAMFRERPGYAEMMRNQNALILIEGSLGADGKRITWSTASMASQAAIAMLLVGLDQSDLIDYLDKRVHLLRTDEKILGIMKNAGECKNAYWNMVNLAKAIARLAELGFIEPPEWWVKQHADEQGGDSEDEQGSGQESREGISGGSDSTSTESGSGESDSSSPESSTESENTEDSGGDSGEHDEEHAEDWQATGSSTENDRRSEEHEGREESAGEHGAGEHGDGERGAEEGEASGDQRDAEQEGSGSEESGAEDSDSDDGATDGDELGGSWQFRDSDSESGAGSPLGQEESSRPVADSGAGGGEGSESADDVSGAEESSELENLDSNGASLGDGTDTHALPNGAAHGQPRGSHGEPTARDAADNQAEPEPEPKLEPGTAEDFGEAVKVFLGHAGSHDHVDQGEPNVYDYQKDTFVFGVAGEELNQYEAEALEMAMQQAVYFDSPSTEVLGVREIFPDEYGSYKESARSFGMHLSDPQTSYDNIAPSEGDLGKALMELRVAFGENDRSKHVKHLKAGKINTHALGKRAPLSDPRLFKKKMKPKKRDYAVLLVMDCSGSLMNGNMPREKRAIAAQAELLNRLGIKFAIIGHTGSYDPETYEQYATIFHVKAWDQPWSDKVKRNLGKVPPSGANYDGHALEFARKFVMRQRAEQRLVMYYSDGKMPASNYNEELSVLQKEIKFCKQNKIALFGVGIGTDSPSRHGLPTVQVDSQEDLINVVRHTRKALTDILN